MAEEPRWRWLLPSGMTRREQRTLVLLIVALAAGAAYQQYRGGWRRERLVLHRAETAVPGDAERPGKSPVARADARLDINRASAEELELLPGIGRVRAEAIVRYRNEHGPFQSLEELGNVAGIGGKTLENLRAYLRPIESSPVAATSPTRRTPEVRRAPPPRRRPPGPPSPAVANGGKINLNTATVEQLDSLWGVGPVLAKRIVEYRLRHGPFRRIEDIQKVRGIGPAVFSRNRHRLTVEPLRPRR